MNLGKFGVMAAEVHNFDGETLGLSRLAQLGGGGVQWDLTPAAWARVREGRSIVEVAIADGADYYGVNTGLGSQKDFGVAATEFADFNAHVIMAEATNMPGPAFEPKVVRAALAVLINNAATGRLGLRAELVERLLRLSRCEKMPEVRMNTSSGMSDLGPLAQLALPLIGRSLDGSAPLIEGPFDLAAKEAVSLINCNAFSIAHGAIVLEEARRLIATFDLAAATSFEAFRANLSYYRPECLAGYRNPYQIASCRRIAEALAGSSLWSASEWRLLQDPLSFRFAMRVNGSAGLALATAGQVYFDDLNCVCDNPVVSLEERAVLTGVNMDTTPLTAVTDMLRQTLAKAAAVSTERSLKCQNPQFSGLPTGLARPGHADGGIQNLILSYISVARQADLRGLAAPVLLDCAHALADGIEDVSGLAPLSVDRTARVIDLCWQVVASEIIVAVWAIALFTRRSARCFPSTPRGARSSTSCRLLHACPASWPKRRCPAVRRHLSGRVCWAASGFGKPGQDSNSQAL
jgi:histidine ammonia-lyase